MKKGQDFYEVENTFLYIFWRAGVCWLILSLCRPFCILERCLWIRTQKAARYQLIHPSPKPSHPCHVLNLAIHLPILATHLLNLATHLPNLATHLPNLTTHLPNLTTHLLNLATHLPNLATKLQ